MSQEAIQEIDMDVFARRIGPYFSWLESRIESGWEQSDHVQKDVLKEVKYLATTMRARFILGLGKEEFVKEVQRTLELFELATDAFPTESDEIEVKIKHFTKGITEELGPQFLPNAPTEAESIVQPAEIKVEEIKPTEKINKETAIEKPKVEKTKPVKVKKEKKPKAKSETKVQKIEAKVQKAEVKAEKTETKIQKTEKTNKVKKTKAAEKPQAKPVKQKTQQAPKPKKTKTKFSIQKWFKDVIFGEDLE